MDKIKFSTRASTTQISDRPTAPIIGKQLQDEWKRNDPSSTTHTNRYPKPIFFDYRVRGVGYTSL